MEEDILTAITGDFLFVMGAGLWHSAHAKLAQRGEHQAGMGVVPNSINFC